MRKIEKRRQAESEKGNGDDDPKAETKKTKDEVVARKRRVETKGNYRGRVSGRDVTFLDPQLPQNASKDLPKCLHPLLNFSSPKLALCCPTWAKNRMSPGHLQLKREWEKTTGEK